jgi:hypothetical protein
MKCVRRVSWVLATIFLAAAACGAAPGEPASGGSSGEPGDHEGSPDGTTPVPPAPVPPSAPGGGPSDPGTTGSPSGNPTGTGTAPAQPVTAPAGQWTWIDEPASRCADGSPTGFGVNLAPGAKQVLLFLQGGGACWDGATCWGPVSTSFYIRTGYSKVEFETDILRPVMLPLRREDPTNPFNQMHLVYVPYCTGDVHAGTKVQNYDFLGQTYPTYHVGAKNLDRFLDRLVATFPDAERIILSGDSAGGFGSAINLPKVQGRFTAARVDVLDDSGQPIQPGGDKWATWQDTWGIELPAGCTGCQGNIGAIMDLYRQRYPENRFGLISYHNDSVISLFMGLAPWDFANELDSMLDRMTQVWPRAHAYVLPGVLHVGLATPTPGLVNWLAQFVNDDPLITTVRP